MKKYLLCFILIVSTLYLKGQDSLFIYKADKIVYRNSLELFDSISFLAPDYYSKFRSKEVFEYMSTQEQLSVFTQMVRIAGFEQSLDDITIWAPVNSSLQQIDLTDTALVRQIVMNHISKAAINLNYLSNSQKVEMLNKKTYTLLNSDGNQTIDTKVLIDVNHIIERTIIHKLSEFIPYKQNLWEYITTGSGFDKFRNYVLLQNSTETNAVSENTILNRLNFLNDEASNGSIIIPTDEAWDEAYQLIYPYAGKSSAMSESQKDEATKRAIIHRCFYSGKINPLSSDTICKSTSGYILKSPQTVLSGAKKNGLSNGNAFVVDQLKMFGTSFGNDEIRVEAEDDVFVKTYSNYAPNIYSTENSSLNVSGSKYLNLLSVAQSSLATLYVKFPIPNTLAQKYNIYCVFVPANVTDETNTKPYKIKFKLTYQNESGTLLVDRAVSQQNTIDPLSTLAGTFITNATEMTKMLVVKDFVFPTSNFVLSPQENVNVILRVENATAITPTEMSKYNRDIKIDCIILEPVE